MTRKTYARIAVKGVGGKSEIATEDLIRKTI